MIRLPKYQHVVPVIDGRPVTLACVYIAAPIDAQSSVKIGTAVDLKRHWTDLQRRYRDEFDLGLFHVAWFPSRGIAARVCADVHRMVRKANKFRGSDWCDVPIKWAWNAIGVATRNIGANMLTHEQYLAICQPARDMRFEEAWAGRSPARLLRNSGERKKYIESNEVLAKNRT